MPPRLRKSFSLSHTNSPHRPFSIVRARKIQQGCPTYSTLGCATLTMLTPLSPFRSSPPASGATSRSVHPRSGLALPSMARPQATAITFDGPPYELERSQIERSKNVPLDIDVTILDDEETVDEILDIIVPHVTRWRKLEISGNDDMYMDKVMIRLAQCDSAPLLETLALCPFNLCKLRPPSSLVPFHGNAPRLSSVALTMVSIDWSSSLLRDLVEFSLSSHRMDARPTWAEFSRILRESPRLTDLELSGSGPAKPFTDWQDDPIELPSLEKLSLLNHDAIYLSSLFRLLSMPNLETLSIYIPEDNSLTFIRQLLRSDLSRLQFLRIGDLFGDSDTINAMYERLTNLKAIYLNCHPLFFTTLMESSSDALYCPNLTTIITAGISGEKMRMFITARAISGIPIKRLVMGNRDDEDLNEEDERWLRKNVESFEFSNNIAFT